MKQSAQDSKRRTPFAEVDLAPVELHFFDASHAYQNDRRRGRLLRKTGGRKRRPRDRLKFEHIELLHDSHAYKQYFRERVPEEIELFGEITPSYSLLAEDTF